MNKNDLMKVVETIYNNDMSILAIDVVNNYVLVELPCGTPSNCTLDEFLIEE